MDSTHRDRGGESLINTVEPMYAFDVHCNGFFPLIVFSYFGNVSDITLNFLIPVFFICSL